MGGRRYARGISPPSADQRTHAGMAVALSRIPASTVSAKQFRTEFPDSLGDNATFTAQPVRDAVVRNARPLFLALLGAVAFETQSPTGVDPGASPVMYEHWRAQTSVVEDVAAFRNVVVNETTGATPDQLRGALVSAAYFRLFGATVARGRMFTQEEDRPGGARVAVISHHLWTRAFGGTDIAGRALRLNGGLS